ncbi:MAG: cryptochrome/photolyase family protein [Hymenobacter sp.]|nr:cryptochrome/photolyase family protein [Hymenobacter sp.]
MPFPAPDSAAEILVLFPHQLYKQHPALRPDVRVVLLEEPLFFTQHRFHQQKLVLHRASMKAYQQRLTARGFTCQYVEAHEPAADIRRWIAQARAGGLGRLHVIDPVDDWLTRRIRAAAAQAEISLTTHPTPNFLNELTAVEPFFKGRKTYFQTDFYVAQRKQRRILLEPDGKPTGGKWTFDAENRQKFPKDETVPVLPWPAPTAEVRAAIAHVETRYAHHYGLARQFRYPVTHEEAEAWLTDFLERRFAKFGRYEDALVAREPVLYHALLTPMLNIGLLDPRQVIEAALATAARRDDIPLNSLEGFLRQIMGWREFIRIVYEREGRRQRTRNFWGFSRRIPPAFWTGTTGIVPVDDVIGKALAGAYNHHIERLMVMGNFMVLCEFDPDEVYRWFMEMYIDAYDWVMVPNVYGMTQFADGGLMTTKPYISGSNYLLKMGDFPKGDWQATWDGLFWRFLHVNRDFFTRNPRLGMLVRTYDKMSPDKQAAHLTHAEAFLTQLDLWNEAAERA